MQDAWVEDFSPDQPRDDHGRWSAGGGAGFGVGPGGEVGGGSNPENWILEPAMAKAPWVLEKAKAAVAAAGYDPERVSLSLKPPKFKVGDREYDTGGVAFTRGGGVDGEGNAHKQGDIVIYGQPDFAKDFAVRGVATHEAMHQKWQAVLNRSTVEGETRQSSGEWEPGPVNKLIRPFMTTKSQALEDNDGVSEYSKSYWDARKTDPNMTFGSAVHETLAEIARLEDEQVWPMTQHMKEVTTIQSELNEKGARSSFSTKPVAPVWMDFYHAVNEAWDKHVKPKTLHA